MGVTTKCALLLIILLLSLLFMRERVRGLSSASSMRDLRASDLLLLLGRGSRGAVQVLRVVGRTGRDVVAPIRLSSVVTRRSAIVARRHIRRHVVAGHSSIVAGQGGGNFFEELNRIFTPSGRSATILMGATIRFTASAVLRPCGPVSSLRRHVQAIAGQGAEPIMQPGCGTHLHQVGGRLAAHVSDVVAACRRMIARHTVSGTSRRRRLQGHSAHAVNKVTVTTILLSTYFLVVV